MSDENDVDRDVATLTWPSTSFFSSTVNFAHASVQQQRHAILQINQQYLYFLIVTFRSSTPLLQHPPCSRIEQLMVSPVFSPGIAAVRLRRWTARRALSSRRNSIKHPGKCQRHQKDRKSTDKNGHTLFFFLDSLTEEQTHGPCMASPFTKQHLAIDTSSHEWSTGITTRREES